MFQGPHDIILTLFYVRISVACLLYLITNLAKRIIAYLSQSFSLLRGRRKVFVFIFFVFVFFFRCLLVHVSFFNWKTDFLLGFFIARISLCAAIPIQQSHSVCTLHISDFKISKPEGSPNLLMEWVKFDKLY